METAFDTVDGLKTRGRRKTLFLSTRLRKKTATSFDAFTEAGDEDAGPGASDEVFSEEDMNDATEPDELTQKKEKHFLEKATMAFTEANRTLPKCPVAREPHCISS